MEGEMAADGDGYPRVLDRAGCLYGQHLQEEMETMRETAEELKQKIDRLTWALAGAALSFGTAAVMLALNLWMK